MTVRGASPPELSLSRPGASGALPRGLVLVPTKKLAKQYRDRVVTLRVFVFLLVFAGLIGGTVAVVVWFQRSSYFVGLDGNRVSIYEGRPGGLLWFKPSLLETSTLTTSALLPNSVAEVRSGIIESSYRAAREEVADLEKLANEVGKTTSASTARPGSPVVLDAAVFPRTRHVRGRPRVPSRPEIPPVARTEVVAR